jgi:hypothetical protein
MKGNAEWSGVEMSTFIAAVVYGAFAVRYLSMLLLTERSARHFDHTVAMANFKWRNHSDGENALHAYVAGGVCSSPTLRRT